MGTEKCRRIGCNWLCFIFYAILYSVVFPRISYVLFFKNNKERMGRVIFKILFYLQKINIMVNKTDIILKPLLAEDIPLFEKWLDKEYIYKRFCPDGEEQRKAWLDEVNNKDGKYDFLTHFIVYYHDRKIGYCLYVDCFSLKDLEEEGYDFESMYGDVVEKNHTYEIGYLIGEEEYLNRGISKLIIQKLEKRIIELGGREISADPSEENIFSIKALLSNGFKKKKDGDYRKALL